MNEQRIEDRLLERIQEPITVLDLWFEASLMHTYSGPLTPREFVQALKTLIARKKIFVIDVDNLKIRLYEEPDGEHMIAEWYSKVGRCLSALVDELVMPSNLDQVSDDSEIISDDEIASDPTDTNTFIDGGTDVLEGP